MNDKNKNTELDTALDVVDYGVTIAGVLGVDTTPEDVALLAGEIARLAIAPETVSKPKNEVAKIIASGACTALGLFFGANKRATSAVELIAKGIIDLTIKE